MAMTKCRECGKDVSKAAPTCPHCGVKRPGGGVSPRAVGCAIPLLLLLYIGYEADTKPPPTPVQQAVTEAQRTASRVRLACQDWVRDRLKAPRTAKFVRGSTQTGRLIGGDSTQWLSRGSVDAENAFGAMLRNRYECQARVRGAAVTPERVTVD